MQSVLIMIDQGAITLNRQSLEAPRLESWLGDNATMHPETGVCENTLYLRALNKTFRGRRGAPVLSV